MIPLRRETSLTLYAALPALAMSLGWGLRGTIGGGPLGATIPGAMVALALCLLLGRHRRCAFVIACGAVGVGLGGEMTYGQTIGLLRHSETMLWGVTGLTVKGAAWGFSGALVTSLGLLRSRLTREEILTGLLLLVAGTIFGWGLINHPQTIYFSDPFHEPREESWAGLLAGSLCLLLYLVARGQGKLPAAFALWGAVAGGIGFGGGGLFNLLGLHLPAPYRSWPWWKMMEFFFGLMYGLGLGLACYRYRDLLPTDDEEPAGDDEPRPGTTARRLVLGVLVAYGAVWLQFHVGFRTTFTVLTAVLIPIALASTHLAWQIGLSLTVVAYTRDLIFHAIERFAKSHPLNDPGTIENAWQFVLAAALPESRWVLVLIAAVPIVALVSRREQRGKLTAAGALLAITWSGVVVALVKVLGIVSTGPLTMRKLSVEAAFVLLAVAVTLLTLRVVKRNTPQDVRAGEL